MSDVNPTISVHTHRRTTDPENPDGFIGKYAPWMRFGLAGLCMGAMVTIVTLFANAYISQVKVDREYENTLQQKRDVAQDKREEAFQKRQDKREEAFQRRIDKAWEVVGKHAEKTESLRIEVHKLVEVTAELNANTSRAVTAMEGTSDIIKKAFTDKNKK